MLLSLTCMSAGSQGSAHSLEHAGGGGGGGKIETLLHLGGLGRKTGQNQADLERTRVGSRRGLPKLDLWSCVKTGLGLQFSQVTPRHFEKQPAEWRGKGEWRGGGERERSQ